MKENAGISSQSAGYLASINYIGYFLGALFAGIICSHKKKFLLWSVVCNILSVLFMGLIDGYLVWSLLRLIAGISSGVIFVVASSMVLDYLSAINKISWSGFLFSGVGIGIVTSGMVVPILFSYFTYEATWVGLGFLSALLAIITFVLWRHVTEEITKKNIPLVRKNKHPFLKYVYIAYGFEGLGYIVSATFLVDIVHNIESLQNYSAYSWVLVGIAAIPSTLVWILIGEKTNTIYTLCSAFILQAIGIIMPIVVPTYFGVIVGSLLFGFTFMGITALTTSYARELVPENSHKTIGILTAVYALGQIIGPTIAAKISSHSGTYHYALISAATVLLISTSILIFGYLITTKRKEDTQCHTST